MDSGAGMYMERPTAGGNDERARLVAQSALRSEDFNVEMDIVLQQHDRPRESQQFFVTQGLQGGGGRGREGTDDERDRFSSMGMSKFSHRCRCGSRTLWGILICINIALQCAVTLFAVFVWRGWVEANGAQRSLLEGATRAGRESGFQSCPEAIWHNNSVSSNPSRTWPGLEGRPPDENAAVRVIWTCKHHPGFHFRPRGKWQNDPNGPMFYRGLYHLFFQYNPDEAVWGSMHWGHAISPNLLDWLELPIALAPDQWYDVQGVFSGSATILDDGQLILLYTGVTNASLQVQNMARPADPLDPYLRHWVKSPANPLIQAPLGVDPRNFRDPTTAWKGSDLNWRILVGSVDASQLNGSAQVFASPDLQNWTPVNGLHSGPGTGIWECPDLFSLPVNESQVAGTTYDGIAGVRKHVLKASLDKYDHDYYAVGTYNLEDDTWTPDDPAVDIGPAAFRYDYGKFYASKTFVDTNRGRTILWGWVNESDATIIDQAKGWASLQAIPRTLSLDERFGNRLIQKPIPEIEVLRGANLSLVNVALAVGSVLPLGEGAAGSQMDIEVVFTKPSPSFDGMNGFGDRRGNLTGTSAGAPSWKNSSDFACCRLDGLGSGPAAMQTQMNMVGVFGLLVLADSGRAEQTAVYFELALRGEDWGICLCNDLTRSSLSAEVDKLVYGAYVPVLSTEDSLTLRVLIDNSIIEIFAQGGRSVITSRVYPQLALDVDSKAYLFNNGSIPIVVQSLTAWKMKTASIS